MVETATTIRFSKPEILGLIDEGARTRRGLSADEFVEQYRSNTLEEPGEVADLIALVDLLPEHDHRLTAA